MAWLILILSALLEAVWATALAASEGFSRPLPTVVFFVAAALSMVGLARAMRSIPVGSAYAVWTGLGAVLTAAWAMITGAEAAGVLKIVFLAGIIACVAGLRLVEGRSPDPQERAGTGDAGAPDRTA
ncbi:Quaternary ammonium compound-resistance protein SugE [Arthrobacter saudimassiliensis]|uniref:Quaternary ammonium compound-resistance protein SugE n=1 Tax=Arthrobacter saudimassiliensis TaxID=1461584 RepID=A0A078MSS8_9MICC|nr:Quaternary ammonium compound-resistance protein SugE [Arthrobacter saudimassiliensis]